MKLAYTTLFAVALAAHCPAADAVGDQSKPLQVFLLAGQSNMQGYGIISAGKASIVFLLKALTNCS